MPAYVVAMIRIEDANLYRKYTDRTPSIVKKYGGRFLTRGEEVSTLEGVPYEDRMVLLEFPDSASVEAWFHDPDYQEAMKFRHASATTHMLLTQEGGQNVLNPDPKL